jgi:predicted ArsR family transcriptional regulator
MHSPNRASSRKDVLDLLRQGPATVDRIVGALGISRSAVRLQLTTLEREGLVARRGTYKGVTKPAVAYEITTRGQVSLSRGYVPMLTRLLEVLSIRLSGGEFDDIMREVGRLMLDGRERPSGPLERRVHQASALFNELGGLTTVERVDDELRIHSHGCPFAATTERHPEACSAVEVLFSDFIDAPVTTCCEREPRLRCCFSVRAPRLGGRKRGTR